MKELSYLIIGQGIAGTSLAIHLIEKGIPVTIVDDNHATSSTRVAAGIIDPITGKRVAKTWNIEQFLPYAETFYKGLEKKWNASFYYPTPIHRFFNTKDEQDKYNQKKEQADYKPYIIKSIGPNETPALNTPFGGFIQNHTGFLDTKEFINHAKTFLKANTTIINEEFHWKDVVLTKNGLQWKDQDYAKIIFCNGFRISKIPPFSDLPYRLAKGHIFTVKMPDYQISTIMTKDKWIVPFKEGMYKVGATYEWQFRSPTEITNAQIKILKKELKEFLPKKITPDKIETGVRPAMVDAKPIVGPHPDFDQLVAFSGLGSKGILLAPYLAKTLSDYLVEEKALLKETLLTRFKK